MIVPPVSPIELGSDNRGDLPPMRLVVLAGRRRQGSDALARRFGASHRCLVPLAGRPLIAHVLQMAAEHPRIASLAICVEREAFDPVWDVLTRLPGRGTVALVEAQDDIVRSVRAAAADWDGPLVVTTADHALLSAASIDAMAEALEHADVAFALAPRASVEGAHHAVRQGYLKLRDGDFAACDIYGVAQAGAVRAVEVFRGLGGLESSAARVVRALGLVGFVMAACGLLTLADAVTRASRHLHLRVRAVVIEDGTQALDVDDDRSYGIARDLLEQHIAHGEAADPAGAAVHREVA